MKRLVRHPASGVAIVRFTGGLLTLIGLIVGIREMGVAPFGRSVILLSFGMILALPSTSAERLILRLASTANRNQASALVRAYSAYSISLITIASLVTIALCLTGASVDACAAPIAVAVAASSWTETSLRQAYFRGIGHLMWGQAPNELLRPLATIIGYYLASALGGDLAPALAVILPSLTCLAAVLIPKRLFVFTGNPSVRALVAHRRALVAFVVISVVAAFLERGYAILTGVLGSDADAAVFAVGLRVIQVGLFGQALAVYYYSPLIARVLSSTGGLPEAGVTVLRRIRVMSFGTSLPIIVMCIVQPTWLLDMLGGPAASIALTTSVLSVFAQVVTGPSQALLTMSGGEARVAITYVVGVVVGGAVFAAMPSWGAGAGLWAVATSYCCFSIGQVYLVKRQYSRLI